LIKGFLATSRRFANLIEKSWKKNDFVDLKFCWI